MDLTLHHYDDGDRVVLQVGGEIDLATAPRLRERIHQLGPSRPTFVLDLDGVVFMDSVGLGLLVGAQRRAVLGGRRLVIVCSQEPVLRLLELTGLDRVLEVHPRLDGIADASVEGGDTRPR